MNFHRLPPREWSKALGVGVANGILLSAIMVPATKLGVSPFPKPVSVAFAQTVLGRPVPLPFALLFHLAYVTFWSMVFVAFFRDSLRLRNALALAFFLWIGVLVVFFPIVGWGFLGLAIGPKTILGAFVLHLLFGLFLWALCRWAFPSPARAPARA